MNQVPGRRSARPLSLALSLSLLAAAATLSGCARSSREDAAGDGAALGAPVTDFSVATPADSAVVSGMVTITGQAGREWVNVAAYDASTRAKIAVDDTPTGGAFALSVDTTQLPEGPLALTLTAFSVAAGQPGGSSVSLSLNVTVQNRAPTTLTIALPAGGSTVSGSLPINGQAGSQWINVAAYDATNTKLGDDVTPDGGVYSLSVDTTKLANGPATITVEGFSMPAGQPGGTSGSASVNVMVENGTPAPGVVASRVHDFVDSLGVNTHLGGAWGPYQPTPGNWNIANGALAYLGARHVRDSLLPGDSDTLGEMTDLASRGILFDLGLGSDVEDCGSNLSALLSTMASLAQATAGMAGGLASIEGANEVNGPNAGTCNGQTLQDQQLDGSNAGNARQAMIELSTDVRSNGALAAIPIVDLTTSAALAGWQAYDDDLGDLSAYANFANAHAYSTNGTQPHVGALLGLGEGQEPMPEAPLWVSETGYCTGGGQTWCGVDETVQMTNSLNILAYDWMKGYPQTFFYELLDELANAPAGDTEGSFGLFHADGTPKLAGTAIHDLVAVLADSGPAASTFTPGSIVYALGNLPESSYSFPLEDEYGHFFLVVWSEPGDWDVASARALPVARTMVTVTFASPAASVKIYDVVQGGTSAVAQYGQASSVQIGLADYPIIVEVLPM